jgi:cobyrinic acid a,c-diamide synthase
MRKRRGGETSREGFMLGQGQVLASYVHAHFASNPWVAAGLVAACAAYRTKKREQVATCR